MFRAGTCRFSKLYNLRLAQDITDLRNDMPRVATHLVGLCHAGNIHRERSTNRQAISVKETNDEISQAFNSTKGNLKANTKSESGESGART